MILVQYYLPNNEVIPAGDAPAKLGVATFLVDHSVRIISNYFSYQKMKEKGPYCNFLKLYLMQKHER